MRWLVLSRTSRLCVSLCVRVRACPCVCACVLCLRLCLRVSVCGLLTRTVACGPGWLTRTTAVRWVCAAAWQKVRLANRLRRFE